MHDEIIGMSLNSELRDAIWRIGHETEAGSAGPLARVQRGDIRLRASGHGQANEQRSTEPQGRKDRKGVTRHQDLIASRIVGPAGASFHSALLPLPTSDGVDHCSCEAGMSRLLHLMRSRLLQISRCDTSGAFLP